MLEALYKEAATLAGRDVEVVDTTDGKKIVEWFCFDVSPPPKAESEEEALRGFVEMMKARAQTEVVEPEEPR